MVRPDHCRPVWAEPCIYVYMCVYVYTCYILVHGYVCTASFPGSTFQLFFTQNRKWEEGAWKILSCEVCRLYSVCRVVFLNQISEHSDSHSNCFLFSDADDKWMHGWQGEITDPSIFHILGNFHRCKFTQKFMQCL